MTKKLRKNLYAYYNEEVLLLRNAIVASSTTLTFKQVERYVQKINELILIIELLYPNGNYENEKPESPKQLELLIWM